MMISGTDTRAWVKTNLGNSNHTIDQVLDPHHYVPLSPFTPSYHKTQNTKYPNSRRQFSKPKIPTPHLPNSEQLPYYSLHSPSTLEHPLGASLSFPNHAKFLSISVNLTAKIVTSRENRTMSMVQLIPPIGFKRF